MSTTEDQRRKSPNPAADPSEPEPIKIDTEGPVDPPSPGGDGRQSPASSNGDNAVREKLKKTNLEPGSRPASAAADHRSDEEMAHSPERSEKPDEDMELSSPDPKDEAAPRRTRKRSHDESEENDTSGEEGANKKTRRTHRRHERKRSREVTAADRSSARLAGVRTPPTHPEEEELEGIATRVERAKSPIGSNERKRALGTAERELEPADREKKMTKTEEKEKSEAKSATAPEEAKSEEPSEKKEGTAATKTFGSGWSNTSSKSPFATAGASSKPLFGSGASTPSSTSTSNSSAPTGFAQSKFGQLSSSSASPFGALKSAPGASPFAKLGSSGNSPFGGSPKLGPVKPIGGVSTSSGAVGFGGSTAKSTNVFGGLKSSSPFGAPVSGTSTFGSGGKIKKASAAAQDDDKEGEEGSDGPDEDAVEPSVDPAIAEKFKKEQEVTTGEEDEVNRFRAPMKVYFFDREAKAWKERGRCTVKLNTTMPEQHDEDADPYGLAPAPPAPESPPAETKESSEQSKEKPKMQARFILRADGTHAVVLNTRIYDGMKFGELNGNEPSGNTAQFLTADGGMWLFKAKPAVVKDLWHQVKVVKEELGFS